MRALYPFALLLGVWWLLSATGNAFVTPSPPDVLDRIEVADAAPVTFGRVLLAYGLALVVGVAVGTAIGVVGPVRASVRPLVSFLFPVPKIALYPALLIVFGLGSGSKVALGFLEAVFPILLATAAGTSQVAPKLLWSAAALGAPNRFAIVIPAALPAILTGARIGLFGAIIGVFLGEMVAGADGLGHVMAVGYRTLDTPAMYVAIIAVSVAGFVLDRAFLLARGRLLAWSVEE
jgi:ABC-type nitrate/sulfonate/bicarbonate transport system permease component